jgi:hypothetical protein
MTTSACATTAQFPTPHITMRRFSSTKASCFLVCWVALVLAAGLVARRLLQAQYNFQMAAEPVRQVCTASSSITLHVHVRTMQRGHCWMQNGHACPEDSQCFVQHRRLCLHAHLQGAITGESAEVERHAAQPQLRPLPHHRQQNRPRTARAPPASRTAGLLDAPPNVPDVWDVLGVGACLRPDSRPPSAQLGDRLHRE